MDHQVTFTGQSTSEAEFKAEIVRGPNSWSYVYVALGFLLTIEGTFVSMVKPWKYLANIEIYAVLTIGTTYLFLVNKRFRVGLLRLKAPPGKPARLSRLGRRVRTARLA